MSAAEHRRHWPGSRSRARPDRQSRDQNTFFHVLRLRAGPHAQYEIRAYAEALCDVIREWVPHACSAFEDYRLNAVQFAGKGMACLRWMLAGETVTQETSGMSKKEWRGVLVL